MTYNKSQHHPSIVIGNRNISINEPPFIIAELSANHNGEINNAFKLIDCAKKAGANAIKLQTYTPDTLTLNSNNDEFIIKSGVWKGRSLYQLYKEAHMPWAWQNKLFNYAKSIGLIAFSSPFDSTAVDFLDKLNVPAYKISSFEIIDLKLLTYVAKKGKPLIISTGMASFEEIKTAIKTVQNEGCKEIAILHCVSGYPSPIQDFNLTVIPDLINSFNLVTGLSDHNLENNAAIVSVALGASIIEKHLTLDRTNKGIDDSFSLEPSEFESLCYSVKQAWLSKGKVDYSCKSSEKDYRKYRKSIYFVSDLNVGQVITVNDIKVIRPGFGMPVKYFDQIIGQPVLKTVTKNTPVTLESIKLKD